MRRYLATAAMLLTCVGTQGKELQRFNLEGVLGHAIDQPVQVLLPSTNDAIRPLSVDLHAQMGAFAAAIVRYPRAMTFEEARTLLQSLCGSFEDQPKDTKDGYAVWRAPLAMVSVHLKTTRDAIVITYIKSRFLNEDDFIKKEAEKMGTQSQVPEDTARKVADPQH